MATWHSFTRYQLRWRRHYLTSSVNQRLFYHVITGDQRTSYPVYDTEFSVAFLIIGPSADTYPAYAGITSLAVDHEGGLWTASQHGIDRLGPERAFWEHFPLEEYGIGLNLSYPGPMAVSIDGRIWVELPSELQDHFAVWDGEWSLWNASLGLAGAQMGHDRTFIATAGEIWVPTDGWLHRIDLPDVESLDLAGTQIQKVHSLARAPDGVLWLVALNPGSPDKPVPAGTHVGLAAFQDDQWVLLENAVHFTDGRKGSFGTLAVSGDGTLWTIANVAYKQNGGTGFTSHVAFRNDDGSWTELGAVNPGATHLLVDGNGRIWAPGLLTTGPDGPLQLSTSMQGGAIASDGDGSLWAVGGGPFPSSVLSRLFISEEVEERFTTSLCDLDGEPVTLTVTADFEGAAQGSITSLPAGIDCPGTCTATFPMGCPVRLTATASKGKLRDWSDPCQGSGECVVHLYVETEVSASFYVPLVAWTEAFPVADKGHVEGIAADDTGALTMVAQFSGFVEVDGQATEGVHPTHANLVVAHFDADRKPLWTNRIGSADGILSTARLRLAPNGDVIVATIPTGGDLDVGEGSLGQGSGRDMVIVRYDAQSGKVAKVHRYGKVVSGPNRGLDVDLDGTGNLYAAAASDSPLDLGDGFTAGPGGFLLVLDKEGNVSGVSDPLPQVNPYLLAAADDGRTVISALYDGPVDLGYGPLPYESNFTNVALIGFDAAGAVLWARAVPYPPVDVFAAPDGRFAVITDYPGPETTLLDETGQPETTWPFAATRGSVAISKEGEVAMVGGPGDQSAIDEPDGLKQATLVAVLKPDGQLLWQETVLRDSANYLGGAAWRGDQLVIAGDGYLTIGAKKEELPPPIKDVYSLLFMAGLEH